MNILIVNKYHGKSGEYIGRGSPLGNPFVIGKHGTREEVIQLYKTWLELQIKPYGKEQWVNTAVCNELNKIAQDYLDGNEVKLLCYCAPAKCHGEVIRDIILKAINNSK